MTIGLVFLTALMAFIVGWLFRQTINVKPWQTPSAAPALSTAPTPAVKTGLWVCLGVRAELAVRAVRQRLRHAPGLG